MVKRTANCLVDTRVFWDVTLCHCCLTLKMKALQSFETSHPTSHTVVWTSNSCTNSYELFVTLDRLKHSPTDIRMSQPAISARHRPVWMVIFRAVTHTLRNLASSTVQGTQVYWDVIETTHRDVQTVTWSYLHTDRGRTRHRNMSGQFSSVSWGLSD